MQSIALLLAPTIKNKPPVEESPVPLWLILTIVAVVVILLGGLILLLAIKRNKDQGEPCGNCGKMMMADWPQCMFCKMPRGFKGASLQVISGDLTGKSIGVDRGVTTIGSDPGSAVVLHGPGVSRKHAGIRRVDGGFELADLGSTNGTYVNGEKVAKRVLKPGDVIRIGTSEMVFKV